MDDADTSILHAAVREAVEETGISVQELSHSPAGDMAIMPFDIDSHYIPPNPKKDEPGHYHHDLRFLFIYNGTKDNVYNADESTGLRWVPFSELAGDSLFAAVVRKIQHHFAGR